MIRHARRPGLLALMLMIAGLPATTEPDRFDGTVEKTRFLGAMRLDGELFHVQGLEVDERRIWVTSVDHANHRAYVHLFDRATGRFLHRRDVTDGARFHPGGISRHDRSIWIPVAENRPDSSTVMLEIDADTLAVRRRIRVGDHIGCVAVAGRDLIAANWDGRLFYVIDRADGTIGRVVRNPYPTHYQDMKFVGHQLVAGGSLTWWSGSVDWIDWPSMKRRRTLRAGAVGTIRPFGRGGPYTGEGMTIEGRDLYVLPEDGPSRVFRFRLDA